MHATLLNSIYTKAQEQDNILHIIVSSFANIKFLKYFTQNQVNLSV